MAISSAAALGSILELFRPGDLCCLQIRAAKDGQISAKCIKVGMSLLDFLWLCELRRLACGAFGTSSRDDAILVMLISYSY
jgi:hypothetical protein